MPASRAPVPYSLAIVTAMAADLDEVEEAALAEEEPELLPPVAEEAAEDGEPKPPAAPEPDVDEAEVEDDEDVLAEEAFLCPHLTD